MGSGWIDSHCHLNEIDNLAHNLLHAAQKGIDRFIIPGTEPKQWDEIASFNKDNVSVAFGVHPWFVNDFDTQLNKLKERTTHDNPVAIGEIGLDYYEGSRPKPTKYVQQRAFEEQLLWAKTCDLPVIIHSVRSHHDVLPMLKKHRVDRGVVHAFSGSYEVACHYVDLGFHLGVGPMIFKSAKTLHAVSKMPLGRLVLETDAPFLALRDTRVYNPLIDLITVAEKLATLFGLPLDVLQKQVEANTSALFFGS